MSDGNGTSWSGRCRAVRRNRKGAEMGNCAGVDWASNKHDVHVADEAGEELLAATFVHDEPGLGALCRTLVRMKVERVAIERPDGVLIERLLDQQPVRPLQRDQSHPEPHQHRTQRPEPRLVMAITPAFEDPALLINDARRVLLAGPINASEPTMT